MTVRTILGPDGRPVRRWREVRSERFRLMRYDGTLVTVGGGVVMRENLPLDDDTPIVPFPGRRTMTLKATGRHARAWAHALGLGPTLTAAQQRGALDLDPTTER